MTDRRAEVYSEYRDCDIDLAHSDQMVMVC